MLCVIEYMQYPQIKNYLRNPTDEGFFNVWRHLSNIFDNPEVTEFKTVQDFVETISAKKNLKRTIETRAKSLILSKEGNNY